MPYFLSCSWANNCLFLGDVIRPLSNRGAWKERRGPSAKTKMGSLNPRRISIAPQSLSPFFWSSLQGVSVTLLEYQQLQLATLQPTCHSISWRRLISHKRPRTVVRRPEFCSQLQHTSQQDRGQITFCFWDLFSCSVKMNQWTKSSELISPDQLPQPSPTKN